VATNVSQADCPRSTAWSTRGFSEPKQSAGVGPSATCSFVSLSQFALVATYRNDACSEINEVCLGNAAIQTRRARRTNLPLYDQPLP
jgi:hypothetical protein